MRSQRENRPILRKASSCARHAIDHSICECPSDSTRASQASSSCVSATVTTPSLGRARPGRGAPARCRGRPPRPRSRPRRRWQAGPILPVAKRPADDRPQQRDPLQDPRTVGAAAGRAQQYHATDARIGMAREHAQDHQPAQAVADEMDYRRLDGGDEIRQCARVVSQPAADRRIRSCAHRSRARATVGAAGRRPGRASTVHGQAPPPPAKKAPLRHRVFFLARRNVLAVAGSMHIIRQARARRPMVRRRGGSPDGETVSGDRIARQMARSAARPCSRVARGRTDRAAARLRLFLLPPVQLLPAAAAARCDGTRRRTRPVAMALQRHLRGHAAAHAGVRRAGQDASAGALRGGDLSLFGANILLFALLIAAGVREVAVARVFFVWVSVYNLFVVSIFWSVTADCFSNTQGRRLFGFIAAGGTAGTFAGPALAAGLAGTLGPVALTLAAAALLEVSLRCCHRLLAERTALSLAEGPVAEGRIADRRASAEARLGGSIFAGATLIARSPCCSGSSATCCCIPRRPPSCTSSRPASSQTAWSAPPSEPASSPRWTCWYPP